MTINFFPNIQPLIDNMRQRGIVLRPNDVLYIDIINIYLINANILTSKELTSLNRKIVDYLEKNKDKTYLEMIKKSKTLQGKVDWEKIERIYQNELADWDKLLEEICITSTKNKK